VQTAKSTSTGREAMMLLTTLNDAILKLTTQSEEQYRIIQTPNRTIEGLGRKIDELQQKHKERGCNAGMERGSQGTIHSGQSIAEPQPVVNEPPCEHLALFAIRIEPFGPSRRR
jgi:hypothetical protein